MYYEIKTLIKSKTIYPSITNAFIFGCLTGLGENDLKELEWLDFELIEGDYFIKLNRNNEIYKLKFLEWQWILLEIHLK